MHSLTTTGIPGVADVPWGTHHCHFYDSREDLADTLVRFFKAGLDGGDACLWVTAEPLRAVDARAALAAVIPDLAEREARGQIEIIDHEDWYLRTGKADAESTLQGWIDREQQALARGFTGLRLTGNMSWLTRADWDGFVDYERRCQHTFRHHRILGLCAYCSRQCSHSDMLDVLANHDAATTWRDRSWHPIEHASVASLANEVAVRRAEASATAPALASRVMLVDDNEDTAELLAEMLAHAGYDVRVALSGAQALALAETWQPAIALLDIGLPDLDGYALAARLRAMRGLDGLRLIAVTGYGRPDDVEKSRAAGFAHHLTKPVRIAAISALLRDHSAG